MTGLVEPRPINVEMVPVDRSLHRLRSAIWIYFLLLILEGAVRKWIPPLSAPFLIIRDPFAIFIWFTGFRLKIGDRRAWICFYAFACIITVLGLLQTIGSSINPLIILYGWRSYVLHLPVIIVLAAILDAEDLRKIGKGILLLSIPMTALMVLQYRSSPDSFLNRGASEAGGQIAGALGHVRPAGTFSFITGPIGFYPVVAAFCLWGLARKDLFPRWLVVTASIATVIAIPVSISRTIAITIGVMLILGLLGSIVRGGIAFSPDRLPQIALGVIVGLVVLVGVAQLPLVQDAADTFTARWTQAQGTSGDNSALESRSVSIFTEVLDPVAKVSILGTGIGSGSTVAVAINGEDGENFQYGENAVQRNVFELGSWLGPLFAMARFVFAAAIVISCVRTLSRGSFLPWFLAFPAAMNLILGAFDQTTSQGFVVSVAGICLAAIRNSREVVL